ncbi:MAG: crotonase/enoyl-CoA hydratase family protein [Candidatus Binatia bacterium]|nr:crotonase/enoyl-CoA hydratase family protein [Candidatus Binatia bacterium]
MSDSLTCERDGDVAILRLDDGKANALSPDLIASVSDALRRAGDEAGAVVLTGRPGRFSAGFDLSVLKAGADAGRELVTAGAELAVQVARHPTPVVLACTGHALAMGAVLLCAGDQRIGTSGDFKIGFNEVAIGMTAPLFLLEFAADRLSKRHLQRATIQAEIYGPDTAVDAGFLDAVVGPDDLLPTALAHAQKLAQLPRGAYVNTRARVRGATLERIEATLAEDMASAFA